MTLSSYGIIFALMKYQLTALLSVFVAVSRQHVVKHGASDPSLRDLFREESPRANSRRSAESSRLTSLFSAADDDDEDSSDGGVRTRPRRSSPKKSTMHATAGRKSK